MKDTMKFLILSAVVTFTAVACAQSYTVTDLGVLGGRLSVATAVNDLGQVVGYSEFSDRTARSHAFFWTATTGMRDLGTLAGNDSIASAINNAGQVAGCSTTSSSLGHAFLWTASIVCRIWEHWEELNRVLTGSTKRAR